VVVSLHQARDHIRTRYHRVRTPRARMTQERPQHGSELAGIGLARGAGSRVDRHSDGKTPCGGILGYCGRRDQRLGGIHRNFLGIRPEVRRFVRLATSLASGRKRVAMERSRPSRTPRHRLCAGTPVGGCHAEERSPRAFLIWGPLAIAFIILFAGSGLTSNAHRGWLGLNDGGGVRRRG